jgi:vancomycin resistance protein YoaR
VAALERGEEKITVTLEKVPGQLIDTERSPDRPLVLLSTGRSNFKGSGAGRKSNVRKAINEHQHNIFIPEGSEFSFNDTLGIVSLSRGWQMALTIFEGVNLRPAPGGGVCQASTTVFRAVLNAGLPILEQKSHSLYVTYYEAYGVGLDATIFPGKQDFRFKNDTGGPIIMQAYTEGDEATINLYGYDDNRSVTLSGPYFAGTEGILPDGKKIRANEIVWTRTVQSAAGTSTDIVASRYQAIPRSLAKNWTASTFQTRIAVTETAPLHGAAEEIVAER